MQLKKRQDMWILLCMLVRNVKCVFQLQALHFLLYGLVQVLYTEIFLCTQKLKLNSE